MSTLQGVLSCDDCSKNTDTLHLIRRGNTVIDLCSFCYAKFKTRQLEKTNEAAVVEKKVVEVKKTAPPVKAKEGPPRGAISQIADKLLAVGGTLTDIARQIEAELQIKRDLTTNVLGRIYVLKDRGVKFEEKENKYFKIISST